MPLNKSGYQGNKLTVNDIYFRKGEHIDPKGKLKNFTPLYDGQESVEFKLLFFQFSGIDQVIYQLF